MSTDTLIDVSVPDIGDFDDVPVIEILVEIGDTVALEAPLITLESDKATMDVPAPAAGVIRELLVSVGDRVSEGTALLRLEGAEEPEAATDAGEPTAASDTGGQASPPAPTSPPAAPEGGAETVHASPSVRRLARELSVALGSVRGTGRKGRLTPDDVRAAADAPSDGGAASSTGGGLGLAPWPKLDFARFGEVERVPRTRIQKLSAPALARNWAMIPHVTHQDEADITGLEDWRRELNGSAAEQGVKVTMVAFLVLACVSTLRRFPEFNASLDGDELVVKHYYNIGFAADTPAGLVVPVIRDADSKGLLGVARELQELSGRAREAKLGPADIQGSTFTISSLGGIGGTAFTPIINAPEVAILGVTRSAMKPVWDGSAFAPRLMLPLSLSYDHRVIDGAAAARFVVHLAGVISDLRRALL